MDPQPWNPNCNRYLKQLYGISAQDPKKAEQIATADAEYFNAINQATKKYLEIIEGILGEE